MAWAESDCNIKEEFASGGRFLPHRKWDMQLARQDVALPAAGAVRFAAKTLACRGQFVSRFGRLRVLQGLT